MEDEELFPQEILKRIREDGVAVPTNGTAFSGHPGPTEAPLRTHMDWIDAIDAAFSRGGADALELARRALAAHPGDDRFMLMAAWAAALEGKPKVCLFYLKRLAKRYVIGRQVWACQVIALAQLGRWPIARNYLEQHNLDHTRSYYLYPPGIDRKWIKTWLKRIRQWKPVTDKPRKSRSHPASLPADAAVQVVAAAVEREAIPDRNQLPRFKAGISVDFTAPDSTQYRILASADQWTTEEFILRNSLSRLSLLKGFEELLCIPHLRGVDHYWYQIETARKVLRQFRGRVLLADEVGLGKTIEAGIVIKEYSLRGMADRILILVPPSLVGQWHEEMETKFDMECVSTHDSLLRRDPAAFWKQPRIIASIAVARTDRHCPAVVEQVFDLVVVDESHHLKNRSSRNWKLVNLLKKRFLLMLTATPVENNLVELYNLLTLLRPGLFSTEKEFKSRYVARGKPRVPENKERLRELMRDVMIRNTRSLVDVKLPPRRVMTIRVDAGPEERDLYLELSELIRQAGAERFAKHRLAMHHLLESAGSTPAAAAAAINRFVKADSTDRWHDLRDRYTSIRESGKAEALFELIERNPGEKMMVFARFLDTLNMLDRLLRERGMSFARFDGRMSGPQKDEAITRFRDDAPILLCTESGGEGRNIQFCNTLINFDLHWNPQVIEQRIGRVHRIGQTREVFVFNLAVKDTIEDRILAILDEKLNMFELVVGEVQSILGEMDDRQDFAEVVFSAWLQETNSAREDAFDELGRKLVDARRQYERTKALDDDLFGEEFEVV